LFRFRCLPRRTRPLFQRGGCTEEPALYFNEGVASGSRRVLFDRLAFSALSNVLLAFAFVRPLSSSHFILSLLISFCLVVLSRRFVSSFCLVVLSRRFSVSLLGFSVAFVRTSFCPYWAVGSRYFRSRYCFVTWIASSSLSSLSSYPPTPHDYNPPDGGGGEGDFRHGDVPAEGKRIGSGANAPTMLDLRRKPSTGVPVSWKGMEGHRSGHALCLEDLGIVPEEAAEKVETFFFPFGLIDCLVCLSRILRWKS
jgi:hypothetical protein